MFIAMNRFKINLGREEDFEAIWRNRDSYLSEVPGFQKFNLVRGATNDEFTLYASHATWDSRKVFEDWTHSDSFKKAHAGAGANRDIYQGAPNFEGFDVVL